MRAVVGTGVVAGAATLASATVLSADRGVGPIVDVVAFTFALALSWAYPLLILKEEESEGLHLDEAFFVAMALLLPPFGVVLVYAVAAVAAHAVRRRPWSKIAFNAGQLVAAAGAGLAVFEVLGDQGGDVGARAVGAAVAGAIAFFVVNSGLVAMAISVVERRPLREIWLEGIALRALVWCGSASLGLLAGLAGAGHPGAVLLALVPLAVLHVVLQGYGRARRDRQRMQGLFHAALAAHGSMGVADVEQALVAAAAELVRCRDARITDTPPDGDALGVRIPSPGSPDRWLVASDRRGVEAFDDADRGLLEAVAAIGATALDNAGLFEQVAVERRKMTDVVTSSSDGIFSVDGEQRIQSWNPAMEHITGFPASDVVGSKCFTVYRPRDEVGNELCVAACPGRCGQRDAVPVQVTTITGELRWLTCTYASMPDGGYVVVARDITAQKQVDDLKADFLATVSHELRTPLTPIQGFLHTLMRDDVSFDDTQRQRFYEVMLRQSERLERLVKDLLDATTLQDPDQLFLPEEVDWPQAVRHVVDAFRGQDGTREIVVEIEPGVPHVVADEQRAEQVLSNLLSNALKYSDGGPIRISVDARDGHVVTTVTDRGPGVPAADRDRIFERFTRLGDHMTRKVGGAGLGLFIAKRLVEGMGGEISVRNAAEGGAAFSFSLPQCEHARSRS